MNEYADKMHKDETVPHRSFEQQNNSDATAQLSENSPNAILQREQQEAVNNSPKVQQLKTYQKMADNSPHVQQFKAYQEMANKSPRVQQFKAFQEMVDNSPRVQQFKAYQEMADNYTPNMVQRKGYSKGGLPEVGLYRGQGAITSELDKKRSVIEKTKHQRWIWNKEQWHSTNVGITNNELIILFPKATAKNLKTLEITVNLKGSDFGITSPNILAHYLAQSGYETGGFTKETIVEGGFYRLSTVKALWGSNSYLYKKVTEDPSVLKDQESFYNIAYSNQNNKWLGNGDEASGDGYKFRGRGYFQLTGRANYTAFTKAYNSIFGAKENFVSNPQKVATNKDIAIISSFWYFHTRTVPLINQGKDFYDITGTINAGRAGLEERKKIYNQALQLLSK